MLIPLGVLGLGSLGWISRFTNPTGFSTTGKGIAVDSSGNVYSTGDSTAGGNNTGYVVKTDSEGVIQWQREFSSSGNVVQLNSIALDSSANVYVVGDLTGVTALQINKYNSSGTLQWQRRLNAGSGATSRGSAITVTSGGTVYVAGRSSQSGLTGIQVAKYNTSGTLQWQKKLSIADLSFGEGISLDSSENVYVVGRASSSTARDLGIVAKYNSSGTLQWQRKLDSSGNDIDLQDVQLDSSGNVYITGSTSQGPGLGLAVFKYNSSGTLQWQKLLETASVGRSISVNSGSVYTVTSTSTGIAVVAKYDTSGNLGWQRSLTASEATGIASDSLGNLYVIGRDAGAAYFIAKFTDDGSTFGPVSVGGTNFTYQATSYTDTTDSSASSTSTLTDATSSLTSETTTFTDSAMNFTGVLEAI